jgi:mono/diheme cytochrome c family protein
MRADWFAVLEQPDGAGRFGDPAYLERFGFIPPDGPSDLNPQGYPVGVAVEIAANQIGLTCAACHTANVEVGGAVLRIDGAPARLDFDAFHAALAAAVTRTRTDPDRFARFAQALGVTDEAALAALRADLTTFDRRLTADAVLRRPVLASGFGRVDALTQIVNSLAVRDQGEPGNLYPVAAPTSYPALWLTSDLEFVQWNPIASSPIARNGGQVLGVFGRTALAPDAGEGAFGSTMLLHELAEIEAWLQALSPPRWDEARMGPIDASRAAEGEALFRENCAGCHNMAPYTRTDPAQNAFGKTFIRIGRVDYRTVGTDPTYVNSLLGRTIATNAVTAPLFDGAAAVPAPLFFAGTVTAAVRRAIREAGLTQEQAIAVNGFRFRPGPDGQPVPYQAPSLTDLKASPLAGVWATGPYLHNGSVPTVYELLSPPEERRAVFWTGGRALDLSHLGYESGDAPGRFRFDTSLPGNRNDGHRFPAGGLTPDQRLAVIEYLKSQ